MFSRYSWSDDLTISRKHLRVHCILYEQDPVARVAPFVYATDVSANGTFLKKANPACTGSQGVGTLMGPDNAFLLDDGDELRISDTVTLIYHSKHAVEIVRLTPTQEQERGAFAARYLITGRLLGEGGYGKVLVAIQQDSQQQLACKVVRIDHLYNKLALPVLRKPTTGHEKHTRGTCQRWPTRVANCFREFDILKDLSHPNIVAIEKVFWSHDTIYIFQELITGGDLFSFLEFKGGRLDSDQSAIIIYQILKGIEFLHGQDIVHRDLKPDNILMTSPEGSSRVVITDFGNARYLPTEKSCNASSSNRYQRMFSYVGTLEFAAPEIHRANRAIPPEEGYSKSVDMWSIGSITATILSGDVIFVDRNHPRYDLDPRSVIVSLAAGCDLSILDNEYHPVWRKIENGPKDFIRKLLVLEEDERMSATEAITHSWFRTLLDDAEKLYNLSVQHWTPREEKVQLVERIGAVPRSSHTCSNGRDADRGITSSYFHSSRPDHPDGMILNASSSQRWRANTPLPSIRDDLGQDLDQAQSPSSNIGYERLHAINTDNIRPGETAHAHGTSIAPSRNQSSPNLFIPSDSPSSPSSPSPGSLESNESLNKTSDEALQKRYGTGSQHARSDELVHVDETPMAEQYDHDRSQMVDYEIAKKYERRDMSSKNQRQHALDETQDSLIIFETPPEIFREHNRSSTRARQLSEHRKWPMDSAETKNGAVHANPSKRRRLSPCRP